MNIFTSLKTSKPMMGLTRKTAGQVAVIKHHSPEVLLVGGILTGVAAAITLARAYKNHDETVGFAITNASDAIDQNESLIESGDVYLTDDSVDMLPLYGEVVKQAVVSYGPPALLAVTSLYLILTSHGIVKQRNKALLATVGMFEKGFREYRERVIADQGVAADERYRFGAVEKTTNHVDMVDGKKKKRKEITNVLPETPTDDMLYARIFDDKNPTHGRVRSVNVFTLKAQEKVFNDLLLIRGTVMLNEVYDMLRFPRTPEGAIVGWSLSNPNGDNFIDFGLNSPINQNEGDNRLLLDFNVSGKVFEYIGS